MKDFFAIIVLSLFFQSLTAQDERKEKIEFDGQIVTALITETDTFIIAELEDVSISSPRQFNSKDERRKYLKYRRYAAVVYPYASDAIKIFREVDYVTKTMSKGKRKRHIKRLSKQLKKENKKTLKKLTKTQGLLLTKMIEKELDRPMYDLIKGLRGGMAASFWNQLGKVNGYSLKEGYIEGKDPIMDMVLKDFNISHEVLEDTTKLESKTSKN